VAFSAATISKMPVKPPRSSPTDSTGVAIPNTGTLIDYDTVALELVRYGHGNPATDTMVEHRSLAPSPHWPGRDGEGRSGSKGGEGPARGDNRMFPRNWVSFFAPTTTASSAATISKMSLKPAAPRAWMASSAPRDPLLSLAFHAITHAIVQPFDIIGRHPIAGRIEPWGAQALQED
jgi:hypothetical protein